MQQDQHLRDLFSDYALPINNECSIFDANWRSHLDDKIIQMGGQPNGGVYDSVQAFIRSFSPEFLQEINFSVWDAISDRLLFQDMRFSRLATHLLPLRASQNNWNPDDNHSPIFVERKTGNRLTPQGFEVLQFGSQFFRSTFTSDLTKAVIRQTLIDAGCDAALPSLEPALPKQPNILPL
jgi:hypothetical protein